MLAVAPIVEGHGEEAAVPILVRRLFAELFVSPVNVLKPIRIPRSKLVKPLELIRAVSLGALKLNHVNADCKLVLVVFDADQDRACELAPALCAEIEKEQSHVDVAVVLAVSEYETWFVAAAESLSKYLIIESSDVPIDPEASGAKKAWIEERFRGKYAETISQPALSAEMDLALCRTRSRSFDKLCRELEKRVRLPV